MAEMLPWFVAPRNKAEMDELHNNLNKLSEEVFAKSQVVSAQMYVRLSRPKSGSKWAEKLAWARVDLKIYARTVTRPLATMGSAGVAIGKSARLMYQRFYEIHGASVPKHDGSGGGFDFS